MYKPNILKRIENCSDNDFNNNDFVFLKPPFQEKEIMCDYKIVNFVKCLWRRGIITFGSDQPGEEELGFITFSLFTVDGKQSMNTIEEMLGKNNLICWKNYKLLTREGLIKKQRELSKHNKIIFEISTPSEEEFFHGISFSEKMLKKIHKILNLALEIKEEVVKGLFSK